MKKVLIVISTLDTGGAQRAVSNIVTHLPEEYHADILLNDDTSIKYPYKGTILTLGMKPKADKTGLLYQLKVFVKRVSRLRKLKKTGEYLACISFLDSANYANILSGRKYCKTIISVRVNLSRTAGTFAKYKYIVKPLAKLLYNRADKVVAVSKGTEVDLRNELRIKQDKLVTIYNGYDIEEIQKRAKEDSSDILTETDDTDFTITTMGRLEVSKGHWHLIRAISYMTDEIKEHVKLEILGDGPLREEFLQLAIKSGVESNVSFLGFKSNPFMVLAKSDLFVFPSLFEGFPNALAEAMCVGLPVVAADCESGVREILAPDTDVSFKASATEMAEYGVIVPVGAEYNATSDDGCAKSIASAIERFYLDEDLRKEYSLKSKQRAGQLSIDSTVKQWISIID